MPDSHWPHRSQSRCAKPVLNARCVLTVCGTVSGTESGTVSGPPWDISPIPRCPLPCPVGFPVPSSENAQRIAPPPAPQPFLPPRARALATCAALPPLNGSADPPPPTHAARCHLQRRRPSRSGLCPPGRNGTPDRHPRRGPSPAQHGCRTPARMDADGPTVQAQRPAIGWRKALLAAGRGAPMHRTNQGF
jgi:hypothetical protein